MLRSCLIATTALALAGPALAQDITTAFDVTTTRANGLRGLSFAPDGKIYVSGNLGDPDKDSATVVGRYNSDGTLDTTFGDGGFVQVDLAPGRGEGSLGVAQLKNGDVVVATNAMDEDEGESAYLLRFDHSGKRIMDWGTDGAVEVVFGWPNADNDEYPGVKAPPRDTAFDLDVDDTGDAEKLVIAGYGSAARDTGRTDNDRYVTRLMASDGSVDPAFNGGKAFTYHSAQNFSERGRRAQVESDGSIMSAGYTPLGELGAHVILIHLNPDGTLDQDFGGFVDPESSAKAVGLKATPGVAILNPFVGDGGFAECYAAARLSDGSYVTAGYGGATGAGVASSLGFKTTEEPDVVSFHVEGRSVDTSWGKDGALVFQSEGAGMPSAEDRARMAVALPDDRVVMAGLYGGEPAAYVVGKDGQPDASVGDGGVITLPNDTIETQFYAEALSPDGKRVAMATRYNPAGARLVVLDVND